MKKLLFILNPLSGKAAIKPRVADIIDIFIKEGYDVSVYITQSSGDAERYIIEKGVEFNRIVVGGGDGTLNEAVSGIYALGLGENSPELGFIPAGTTNDFAHSLNIPDDLIKATNVAAKGTPYLCDTGSLNGKTFNYVAAFGTITQVTYTTPQAAKNTFGYFAYLFEAVKAAVEIEKYHLCIEINGKTIEGDFAIGLICNSRFVGGFENNKIQDIEMDDGIFEVILIRDTKNMLEFNKLVNDVIVRNIPNDNIIIEKAKHLKINSDKPVAWNLDGELGGEYEETEIINRHKSLKILVPFATKILK